MDTGTKGNLEGGVWLRRRVCVLAVGTTRGCTGRGYGALVVAREGHSTTYKHFYWVLLVVMHQTLSLPNFTKKKWEWRT